MALTYDLTKIKNYKRIIYRTIKEGERDYDPNEKQYRMKPKWETLILSTMIVGIREITEDNYQQFFNRLHLIETTNGSFFWKSKKDGSLGKPDFYTLEDIQKMIGLKTNASTTTKAQFLKNNKIPL